jgi:Neutral/alkaline non-lysosomal ceramidase, N-terminal
MPTPLTSAEMKRRQAGAVAESKAFLKSAEGKQAIIALKSFRQGFDLSAAENLAGARAAIDVVNRLPSTLVETSGSSFVDFASLDPDKRAAQYATSVTALDTGIRAFLMGAGGSNKGEVDKLFHIAFGADAAARQLGKPFGEAAVKLPTLPGLTADQARRLNQALIAGTLQEIVSTFARCGALAQAVRNQTAKPFGKITSISPNPACAGSVVRINYEGFNKAPDFASGERLVIVLPGPDGAPSMFPLDANQGQPSFSPEVLSTVLNERTGATIAGWTDVLPELPKFAGVMDISAGSWQKSGSIEITLPDWIGTGWVGFFLLPAPLGNMGCETGSLVAAVGALQTLGAGLGGSFIGLTQGWMHIATQAEAASLRPFETTVSAASGCWLEAGRPVIKEFVALEAGPIHPRGTVTLRFTVLNADHVEIVPEPLPDQPVFHELPIVTGPFDRGVGTRTISATRTITVTCTQDWIGSYVLKASNNHGCSPDPVMRRIDFRSGFTAYRLGAGKDEILFGPGGPGPGGLFPNDGEGLALAGFADETQIATSRRMHTNSGGVQIPEPLFARAFIIAQNDLSPTGERIAIVVADIWTCTQAVKTEVVRRLALKYANPLLYPVDRVMIAGTHTHAVPGGYSDYHLYNFSMKGFNATVFERIVGAIVRAIEHAHDDLQPGHLSVGKDNVVGCGENRSDKACARNPEAAITGFSSIDREMLLLRFDRLPDFGGPPKPFAMLNWYAIHPTSLGYRNTLISGDNKGYAALKFEEALSQIGSGFIAAFGNSNAGDISGNVVNGVRRIPMGGPTRSADLNHPDARDKQMDVDNLVQDVQRMKDLGQIQCNAALSIFNGGSMVEIAGPIAARHTHIDMSHVDIEAKPGARTWPAAIGVSFGAGSSEDSIPMIYLGPGFGPVKLDPLPVKISEGINQNEFFLGALQVWSVLGPAALGALGGLLTTLAGGPVAIGAAAGIIFGTAAGTAAGTALAVTNPVIVASTAQSVLILLDAVRKMPTSNVTSYIYHLLGKIFFPGPVLAAPPKSQGGGSWSWVMPDHIMLDQKLIDGHGEKPIMFPVGLWKLQFTPAGASKPNPPVDCPLVPHIIPMQMLQIGQLSVVGVPAEFTTVAGRRLKRIVQDSLGHPGALVAISNYANAYSGYVTTEEEYGAQHYEGASTLYGPHTLEAYLQEIGKLARDIEKKSFSLIGEPSPFVVPARFERAF